MAEFAIERFLSDLDRYPNAPIDCAREDDRVVVGFQGLSYEADLQDMRELASFLRRAAAERDEERAREWLLHVASCLTKASVDSHAT